MRPLTLALLLTLFLVGSSEARPFSPPSSSILSTKPGHQQATRKQSWHWHSVPRGGGGGSTAGAGTGTGTGTTSAAEMITEAALGLKDYMKGPKSDTLLLLATTALNEPVCQKLSISPILGFLATGLACGPNGMRFIKDVHTTEIMAELGIVLFLFEMGIHLDLKTLVAMRTDVFGIGLGQFTITAIVIAALCWLCFGLSGAASTIVGWSLALSSSAFVLQLLKDKDQMSTPYGKSSFGTLLLQDLMVVPLLVITPILAGTGGSVKNALTKALLQITMALSVIAVAGKFLLNPILNAVVATGSQESLVGMILTTVLGFSFLTEGLGLSNTLGAFLAGMLMAETNHKHAVEKEASPYRGILVGLFFFTVGFEIDLNLIVSKFGLVSSIVVGLMALKAALATVVCLRFGLPLPTARRVGLVLSQGGEFAFVAFRTARALGILDEKTTKLLLTCVSLTMALTPLVEELGSRMALPVNKVVEVSETPQDLE